jgi:hypothetical protein
MQWLSIDYLSDLYYPFGKNDLVMWFILGYDGQGDWSAYPNYLNLDGGMAQVSTLFSCFHSCGSYFFPKIHLMEAISFYMLATKFKDFRPVLTAF